MSLELPGWVVDAFNLLGLPWPAINEDDLRGWANDLREFTTEITQLSQLSHDAVHGLKDTNQSGAVKTLAEHWDHHHSQIMAMRGPMHEFAGALDIAAEAVVVQKGVVIAAAATLAAEALATQGEAVFTAGIAEGELPLEVALTKRAVKFALQELENKIIGYLINQAAKEVSNHVSATVSKMLQGSTKVVFEGLTLRADYQALQRVAATARTHKSRVENASMRAHRRANARKIETRSPGGKWHVVQVLEAALRSIADDVFKKLPGALHRALDETARDLEEIDSRTRNTDAHLSGETPQRTTNSGTATQRPGTEVNVASNFNSKGSLRKKNRDGSYTLYLNGEKYPMSARHVRDAQNAGHPKILTVDNAPGHKDRADTRRGQSLDNFKKRHLKKTGDRYQNVTGEDLDEYPPARSKEGGKRVTQDGREIHASVRSIDSSDNRGSGSAWWNHGVKGLPDGTRIHIIPITKGAGTNAE